MGLDDIEVSANESVCERDCHAARAIARITVAAADQALAAAVVEELERAYLWRAIVSQARRVLIDASTPSNRNRTRDGYREPH